MTYRIPRRASIKAPATARLNRGSAQARGLLFWAPLADAAVLPRDYGPYTSGVMVQTGTAAELVVQRSSARLGVPYIESMSTADDTRFTATMPSGVLPTLGADPFTIALWCRFDSYKSLASVFGFGHDLVGAAPTGGNNRGFLQFGGSGDYYFWGGGADWDTGVAIDVDGVWRHIAFTMGADKLVRFYRNGVLSAGPSSAVSGLATTKDPNTVVVAGDHPSGASSFDGSIADCRIYDRRLSAGAVLAIYDPMSRWELWRSPSATYFIPEVVAPGGFQSAWAKNATVTLQPGQPG